MASNDVFYTFLQGMVMAAESGLDSRWDINFAHGLMIIWIKLNSNKDRSELLC